MMKLQTQYGVPLRRLMLIVPLAALFSAIGSVPAAIPGEVTPKNKPCVRPWSSDLVSSVENGRTVYKVVYGEDVPCITR